MEKQRSFLLGGGKDGHFYLAYRDKLGRWTPENSGILQAEQLCEYHIHGAPVVWSSGPGNTFAYVWSERDALKSFKLGSKGFGPPRQFSEVRFPVMEDRMPAASSRSHGTGPTRKARSCGRRIRRARTA